MACFIFAALVVLLDQMSKMWISGHLDIGARQDLIPGVISLTHTQNTGASFGLLSDMRWLLVGVSSLAVIVIIVLIIRFKSVLSRFGLAAVLGGAAGNLIDRILSGKVVDMFEFEFMNFAIFNVADCFITIGMILFVLSIIFSEREIKRQRELARRSGERRSDGFSISIFGGTAKDLSETKILEEYDIERLLREYNPDEMDD